MTKKEVEAMRTAVANYMRSEGCSCCQDYENHPKHKAVIALLLGIKPRFDEHDVEKEEPWFDFSAYATKK